MRLVNLISLSAAVFLIAATPAFSQSDVQLPSDIQLPEGVDLSQIQGLIDNMSPEELQDILISESKKEASGPAQGRITGLGKLPVAIPEVTDSDRNVASALLRRTGLGPDRTDGARFARDCQIVMGLAASDDNQVAAFNENVTFDLNNENVIAAQWWGRVLAAIDARNGQVLTEERLRSQVESYVADVQNGGIKGETRVHNGAATRFSGEARLQKGGFVSPDTELTDAFMAEHAADCKQLRSDLGGLQ